MKYAYSLNKIAERAAGYDGIIIFGAGERGKRLLKKLKTRSGIRIQAFFDNNQSGDALIDGIEVIKPELFSDSSILYVIAANTEKTRQEMLGSLKKINIPEKDIETYYSYDDYDYFSQLNEDDYEFEVQELAEDRLGKRLNLDHPETYNEKLNWEKLHFSDSRKTRLSDKIGVRDWVKEKIGEEYLTKIYGTWSRPEEIDFSVLPDSFVLKSNKASGQNILVKNKSELDVESVCRKFNEWHSKNYAYCGYAPQYRDIEPKILCEEYLDGVAETVYDYDIFCFHGKPEYIWCIKGSHRPGCVASFYSLDWKMQPFSYGYPKDEVVAPRPKNLDKMLDIAKKLSKDFDHVRVDLYDLPDGRVLFGEMSFATWGGLKHFLPEEYDLVLGRLI